MKLLLLTALVLTSCGKNITKENAYNDSSIKAYQVMQDARISALQAKLDVLNSHFDSAIIDFGNELNNVQASSENIANNNYTLLNNAMLQLASTSLTVIKICASGEHLLKNSSGVYAVFAVSNNNDTYLGKLANDTTYRTTDEVQAKFKLVNGEIVCL